MAVPLPVKKYRGPGKNTIRAPRLPVDVKSGAGFVPAYLDESIHAYIQSCENTVNTVLAVSHRLEEAVSNLEGRLEVNDTPQALKVAESVSSIFERVSRGAVNIVRAADELSRLRSFASGGPDSRPDLTARSEVELRVLLFKAVQQIGCSIIDSSGKPLQIEGEVVDAR